MQPASVSRATMTVTLFQKKKHRESKQINFLFLNQQNGTDRFVKGTVEKYKMSYNGRQNGMTPPRRSMQKSGESSASQGSNSDLGLSMPQGYQVKTSPSRRPPSSEQRLVMLAKHPYATNGDVQNALQQGQARKQRPQQQRVAFQPPAPPGPRPVPVAHMASPQQPQQTQPRQDRDGFQQGGYTEQWKETPPPEEQHQSPKRKKKVFGKLGSVFSPSVQDAQSIGDDSNDNSYAAKSHASEKTRKVSNVDERARAKRMRKEAGDESIADRCGSCFVFFFKTRTGIIISVLVFALILAAVLTVGAALGGGVLEQEAANVDNLDDIETWIPRPRDSSDDEDTEFPTPSPTGSGTGQGPGIIPSTNSPDPQPTQPPFAAPVRDPTPPPTRAPTPGPTRNPTPQPTPGPSPQPTPPPTRGPTQRPTKAPSRIPTTFTPTKKPTPAPTNGPTLSPSTSEPSASPTSYPSALPTYVLRDLEPLGATLSGTESGQRFGYSVALSADGTVLAVGIPFASVDASSKAQAGKVQVYEWRNNRWDVRGATLVGRNAQDKFGSAIGLSDDGSILVVSEPTFQGAAGDRSGNVRTFLYNSQSGSYTPIGSEIEGAAATDHFGVSLSLSKNGRRLAVGAPYHDNSVNGNRLVSGQVRTFEWQNNNWVPLGSALAGESHFDWFGWVVDLNDDGDLVCGGAPRNLEYGGYVTCYEFSSGDWDMLGGRIRNTIQPLRYDDNFGHSLRINGNRVAIGAPGKNLQNNQVLDSGLVAVYEYSETARNWQRLGNSITSVAPGQGDQLGFAVDLQGSTLVVSTPGKDNRGQVDLYYYNPSSKEWEVNPNPLKGATGSNFGFSVHLATNIAVGSAVSDGINSGMVNIYHQQ